MLSTTTYARLSLDKSIKLQDVAMEQYQDVMTIRLINGVTIRFTKEETRK